MTDSTLIWHNGALKPWHEATVHVSAHALHYGSSVFEGERVYATPEGPRFFRLADHTRRLFASARVYGIDIGFSPDAIDAACREVVRANQMDSAYVRPLVFRGVGGLGVLPAENVIDVAILALPWGSYHGDAREQGADVCVSSWNRAAPNTFPAWAKAGGNYLSSQLIAMEARRGGYAEGIALGCDGLLSEGAGENLFLVLNGELVTPPTGAGVLVGITRDSVIALAAELGIACAERALPREALLYADEVFMCGTAAEITPVRSVDGTPVGNGGVGPVTRALQEVFFGLFDGRTEDRWGWLTGLDEIASAGAAGGGGCVAASAAEDSGHVELNAAGDPGRAGFDAADGPGRAESDAAGDLGRAESDAAGDPGHPVFIHAVVPDRESQKAAIHGRTVREASHPGDVLAVREASHPGDVSAVREASHPGDVSAVREASHPGDVSAVREVSQSVDVSAVREASQSADASAVRQGSASVEVST